MIVSTSDGFPMRRAWLCAVGLCSMLFLLPGFGTHALQAQGVTSAGINGVVVSQEGRPLSGAQISVVHDPSGTRYGSISREDGRFNIRNMRVGGPFTVQAQFIGFRTEEETGVFLELGQDLRVNFTMVEQAVTLAGITVSAETDALLSSSRAGAGTNVSREQIERLPTISRSLVDFTRLTPQFNQVGSGGRAGTSVAGTSSRFNNIQVDGADINDAFGLESSGTPGGSSGTQPISLDAIQEFRVAISPYSVLQGNFTGGSINVITRSGTNVLEGSVYALGRNETFVGEGEAGNRLDDFSEFTTGFRIGGPILQDRLFYFANLETVRRTDPLRAGFQGEDELVTFGATRAQVEEVARIARTQYGREVGSLDAFDSETTSNKVFARIDWNVSEAHKLTTRFNFVKGELDDGIFRGSRTFNFEDRFYRRENTNTSSVVQLNSTISPRLANELRVSLQTNRQPSTLQFDPFPSVRIDNVGATGGTIQLGPDQFRGANNIDANVFEFTNNLHYFAGDHTLTFGTQNRYSTFDNLFIRNFFGFYQFLSPEDFARGEAFQFERNYSAVPGEDRPLASFEKWIFAGYVQDDWTVNDRLRLTTGLRVELPHFPSSPNRAPGFEELFGFDNSEVPNGNVVLSPRVGFNYDVDGRRGTQLRGGIGVFSGDNPAVWISNSFSNDASLLNSVFVRGQRDDAGDLVSGTGTPFRPDPANQFVAEDFGLSQGSAEINLTDPDFKSPRVWRANLAVDRELTAGLVATGEFIYTGVMDGMQWKELNLQEPTATTPDGRVNYQRRRVSDDFQSVILLTNTNQGYSHNTTVQLQKQLGRGILPDAFGSLSYTHSRVNDINSVTSSQARSNVRDLPVGSDVNDPPLATSDFELRHRVLATASYRLDLISGSPTTFTLIYDGLAGSPYSYVYRRGGDPNGDRFDRADLIFVPADRSQVDMSDEDWTAFNAFIEGDEALRSQRGQIVERNSARAPWVNLVDFRASQVVRLPNGHRFELTADILNFANLFNSSWGQVRTVGRTVDLVDFLGYTDDGRVRMRFPDPGEIATPSNLGSRWQLQLGGRYTF